MEGDRNTRFFHRMIKIQNIAKAMYSLKVGNNILTSKEDISDHVVQHYNILFNSIYVLQENTLVEEDTYVFVLLPKWQT